MGFKAAFKQANAGHLIMSQKALTVWFSSVSIVGILFGLLYSFYGLAILPVPRSVLVPWGNGVYGATLMGFSVTLFFAGRHAFRKGDSDLMRALLYGVFAWLVIETLFSLYFGVFFNAGVDIALTALFGFPLIRGIRKI